MKIPCRPKIQVSKRCDVCIRGLEKENEHFSTDFGSFLYALASGALGVSIALLVSTVLFSITAPLSGSNLEIVTSLQRLATSEPREKGFLFLASILGCIGAFTGASCAPVRSVPKARALLGVLTLGPRLNIWVSLAMLNNDGIFYAALGILQSLVVLVVIIKCQTKVEPSTNAR